MSHKIIKTRNNKKYDNTWSICCASCHHIFDDGEDRHEWRMHLTYGEDDVAYRNGSFKTVNCNECFVKTMVIWQRSIDEALKSMPQRMRELA